jgi:hypothetical protein
MNYIKPDAPTPWIKTELNDREKRVITLAGGDKHSDWCEDQTCYCQRGYNKEEH